MKALQEALARAKRGVSAAIKETGMTVKVTCPVSVWNNPGNQFGIVIESDVVMGEDECVASASFVVTLDDEQDTIEELTALALSAIEHRMLVKIKPKAKVNGAAA